MFLVLNNSIISIRDCSSEPAEHYFGMLLQRVKEFVMCQLVGLLDSVKRRNTLMDEHNWLHISEEQKGCNESLLDYFL